MSVASPAERILLDLINEERASAGLAPVALELDLNESAETHSAWMLDTDTFSHTGANGSRASDRMEDAGFTLSGNWTWGENIAWQSERGAPGIEDDVQMLHQSLMNSPGHRANILSPDFEYVGLGIEVGEFDGFEAVMLTQNFARTDAETRPDTGDTPAPAPDPVEEPVEPFEPDLVADGGDTPEQPGPTEPTPAPVAPDPTEPAPQDPCGDNFAFRTPADELPTGTLWVFELVDFLWPESSDTPDDDPMAGANGFSVADIEGFMPFDAPMIDEWAFA